MIIGSRLGTSVLHLTHGLGRLDESEPGVKNFPANKDAPRHYEPHRPVQQIHMTLDGSIHFERSSFEATAYLVLKGVAESSPRIELNAYELTVHEVSVVRLNAWSFADAARLETQAFEAHAFEYGDGKLSLTPAAPIKNGELLAVKIRYETREPRAGLYFVHKRKRSDAAYDCIWTQGQDTDSPYWFPCQDDPRLKMTTLLKMSFPAAWEGLGNGELISETTQGGLKSQAWSLPRPHAPYLVAFAAGELETATVKWRGKDVTVLVPRAHAALKAELAEETARMMEFYSEYWSYEYPWSKYGQAFVADFIYGGMENTSATINTDMVLGPKAYMDGSEGKVYLVMHELAHQWFGDTVTCQTWAEGWLNEGFATQSEMLWDEHINGPVNGLFYARHNYLASYLGESESYQRPLVFNKYEFVSEIFDGHLYEKGALVLNHLRDLLGEGAFRRAVGHYLKKNEFKPVNSFDFMEAIEEATGINPRKFFDTYVFRAGHIELDAEIKKSGSGERLLELHLTQKHKTSPDFPLFDYESFVFVQYKDGTREEIRVATAKQEERLVLPVKGEVAFAIFDPRSTLVGKVEHKLPEGFCQEILARSEDQGSNGYFKSIAARNLLAQNATPGNVDKVAQWLAHEPAFRARIEGYALIAESNALCAPGLLAAVREAHPLARKALLEARAKVVRDAPREFADELLKIARDALEVIAVREGALAGVADMLGRIPELRLGDARDHLLKQALELTSCGSHLGFVEAAAYKIVGELGTAQLIPSLVAPLQDVTVPTKLQIGALGALAQLSARLPEARGEIRPALLKFATSVLPARLVAALPAAWVASQDSAYDSAFQGYIHRKNYGLLSMLIPRARRAYDRYGKVLASSGQGDKPAEISDLKQKVTKLEKDLDAMRAILEELKPK